jgi:hypothetical protein
MIESRIQYFKEKGKRKTVDDLQSTGTTPNNLFVVFDADELAPYMTGRFLQLVHPEYLDWLEEKAEKLTQIVKSINDGLKEA